jgi:hypothetical protein
MESVKLVKLYWRQFRDRKAKLGKLIFALGLRKMRLYDFFRNYNKDIGIIVDFICKIPFCDSFYVINSLRDRYIQK